jgi:hypothetical protein
METLQQPSPPKGIRVEEQALVQTKAVAVAVEQVLLVGIIFFRVRLEQVEQAAPLVFLALLLLMLAEAAVVAVLLLLVLVALVAEAQVH